MLFKEIIAVYSENHMKHEQAIVCGQSARTLIIKAGGTQVYHWALRLISMFIYSFIDARIF
jgi:hypothetical protein